MRGRRAGGSHIHLGTTAAIGGGVDGERIGGENAGCVGGSLVVTLGDRERRYYWYPGGMDAPLYYIRYNTRCGLQSIEVKIRYLISATRYDVANPHVLEPHHPSISPLF